MGGGSVSRKIAEGIPVEGGSPGVDVRVGAG